ncbi:transporter [Cesiribacter sp. SM1]|uniref:transporter n=1 Tax=Cesiribacter sp. SM1 TaxID=2861196 RepID=UPI001CD4CFAB|nr:transporter [Cesiribacter sp. SM1]
MKKILMAATLMLGLLITSFSTLACDKGCTMGGSYLGILPQFNKHFVGLRYNTRSYTLTGTHTHMMDGMPHTHQVITEEQYSSMEAWGRFYPTRRIQLFAFVPYVMNSQSTNGSSIHQQGLGDISLMANYSLINTGDSASHTLKHTLQLGGGAKLPTGNYSATYNNEVLPANMQAGSGSVDLILNALYTIRYKQTGLSSDFTYRFNGEGKNDYQFGNRYNGSTNLFYWHKAGAISLLPSAGLYFEKAQADSYHNQHKMQGGGGALFSNLGLNAYYKGFAVGATCQLPLAQQNLHHITKANSRTQLSVSWMF